MAISKIIPLTVLKALAGLTMGADPIVYAYTNKWKTVNPLIVRKEQKAHGTKTLVQGLIPKEGSVVIIEDVTTTGGSALKAAAAIQKESGLKIKAIITLLDRQEGASENIAEYFGDKKVPFHSIYTKEDIMNWGRKVW